MIKWKKNFRFQSLMRNICSTFERPSSIVVGIQILSILSHITNSTISSGEEDRIPPGENIPMPNVRNFTDFYIIYSRH